MRALFYFQQAMTKPKLTAKQQRFVEEYLVDLCATQAAIRAGYSKKTASVIGVENLGKPNISEAIQAAMDKRSERTRIDADWVMERLRAVADANISEILTDDMTLKPISEWPIHWQQNITSFEVLEQFEKVGDKTELAGFLKKIRWPDSLRAVELIGKHSTVGAFKERVEHSGSITMDQIISEISK